MLNIGGMIHESRNCTNIFFFLFPKWKGSAQWIAVYSVSACRYQSCCNRQPGHNRKSVRNEGSHDECHAKVASTNQYFIFAPLSFRNSQEDLKPISALLGANPLLQFIVGIRLSHLCIAETNRLSVSNIRKWIMKYHLTTDKQWRLIIASQHRNYLQRSLKLGKRSLKRVSTAHNANDCTPKNTWMVFLTMIIDGLKCEEIENNRRS